MAGWVLVVSNVIFVSNPTPVEVILGCVDLVVDIVTIFSIQEGPSQIRPRLPRLQDLYRRVPTSILCFNCTGTKIQILSARKQTNYIEIFQEPCQ